MVKAKLDTKTVVTETFTLTLTREEANIVCSLTGNVNGAGPKRKSAEGIFQALCDAGADYHGLTVSNVVHFNKELD